MNRIEKTVFDIAKPIVEAENLELWDVEYVTEAGQKYLRVYLDSPNGIDLEACEKISRILDPILDEKDPVPDSYIFEVGSAGCDRQLKRPSDFEKFMGSDVDIKLYSPVDGSKQWTGRLAGYEDGTIRITADQEHSFTSRQVASVRLHVDF